MNAQQTKELVDHTERRYRTCLETLREMKQLRPGSAEKALAFQSAFAEALFRLQTAYETTDLA